MAFCTNCGAQQGDDVKFCTSCGQTMNTAPKQEPVSETAPPSQPPSEQQQPIQSPAEQQPSQPVQPSQPQPAYTPQPPPAYAPPPVPPPAQPVYAPPPYGAAYPYGAAAPAYAVPSNFREILHSIGSSTLFLVGIILFTAGSVISAFIPIGFTSIFSLIWLIMPVTAFWLIFSASKSPRIPERISTAVTLFKVKAVIEVILFSIAIFVLVVISVAVMTIAGAASSMMEGNMLYDLMPGLFDEFIYAVGDIVSIIGVIMLVAVIIMLIIMVLYYKSLLNILSSIRKGITLGRAPKISGTVMFSVMTYIGVAFAVISALTSAGTTGYVNDLLWELPYELRSFVEPYIPASGNGTIQMILTILTNAGIVLCLLSLGKLNSKVKANNVM